MHSCDQGKFAWSTTRDRSALRRDAFSLVELLIVIVVLGILVGAMIPKMEALAPEQLRAGAQIVAADLAYARDLAVVNGSRYEMQFDVAANRYTLRHTGDDDRLDQVPPPPHNVGHPPAASHAFSLDDVPRVGVRIELAAVLRGGQSNSAAAVEFGPLGETTSSAATAIWLAAGRGGERRYIAITIDPVTGLTRLGDITAHSPLAGDTDEEPETPLPDGASVP